MNILFSCSFFCFFLCVYIWIWTSYFLYGNPGGFGCLRWIYVESITLVCPHEIAGIHRLSSPPTSVSFMYFYRFWSIAMLCHMNSMTQDPLLDLVHRDLWYLCFSVTLRTCKTCVATAVRSCELTHGNRSAVCDMDCAYGSEAILLPSRYVYVWKRTVTVCFQLRVLTMFFSRIFSL